MKSLICCLVSFCIIINAGIAQQLSFLNLTANKLTSDTVFIGITNDFISKQSLAGIKFTSENASIVVDEGILKITPHVRGKVIIEYHSDLAQGKLLLNATTLPAPTPVLKMVLSSAASPDVKSKQRFKLELFLPGCAENLNQFEVVSFKAKVGGKLIAIGGNRLPGELLSAAKSESLADYITIESIKARSGLAFQSFTLGGKYTLGL